MAPHISRPGRTAIAFLVTFNVALGLLVLYLLSPHSPPESSTLEYKDFISILLTGLAVMIAVATILLAAAAIWGFELIRKEARLSAEHEASVVAERVAREVAGP